MVKTLVEAGGMSFDEWSMSQPPDGQRVGQHLFNTAPDHIHQFVRGVRELDPFYVDCLANLYILNNFLLFASLVWDVTDPEELKEAHRLVMAEPNARR